MGIIKISVCLLPFQCFMRTRIIAMVSVLTVQALFSTTIFADEDVSDKVRLVTIDRFNWVGDLPEKRLVKAENRYGNISTRTITKPRIIIQATIQKIGKEALTPTFDIQTTSNGLSVIVVYEDGAFIEKSEQRNARTDIEIYLPRDYDLDLMTTFGDIKVKKHYSNIRAVSSSGNIKTATHGEVDLLSDSGDIFVELVASKWKQDQKLISTTGDIGLLLPKVLNLDLDITAGAGVISNFDAYGLPYAKPSSSQLKATFSDGETRLISQTKSGSSHLTYFREVTKHNTKKNTKDNTKKNIENEVVLIKNIQPTDPNIHRTENELNS